MASNGGFSPINGEYRWFLHAKKWCFFNESGNQYAIEGNINVSKVYNQLTQLKSKNSNFRWNDDITECWIVSDMDAEHVYYAAPMQFHDKIPSNFSWISVHGSDPAPVLTQVKLFILDSKRNETE